MADLAKVQVQRETDELFWDDVAPDALNFAYPDAGLNAYEGGEGTNLVVIEGPEDYPAAMVADRLDAFIAHLAELGYSAVEIV